MREKEEKMLISNDLQGAFKDEEGLLYHLFSVSLSFNFPFENSNKRKTALEHKEIKMNRLTIKNHNH